MAVITGKDGAVTLGGGAINGTVREWMWEGNSKSVETDGMGDAWIPSVHIRSSWKATIRALAPDVADWDLDQGLLGTAAAVALKRKSADTNPWFSDTGLVTRFSITHNHEEATEFEIDVIGSTASAPTFDTTPA